MKRVWNLEGVWTNILWKTRIYCEYYYVKCACITICKHVLGVVAFFFNPISQEAEAGEYLWVPGQPDLHGEFQDGQPGLPHRNQTKPPDMQIYVYVKYAWLVFAKVRKVGNFLIGKWVLN